MDDYGRKNGSYHERLCAILSTVRSLANALEAKLVTNVLGTSRIGIVREVLEDGTVGTFVIRAILEKMFERVIA